jgi:hypothetical protein
MKAQHQTVVDEARNFSGSAILKNWQSDFLFSPSYNVVFLNQTIRTTLHSVIAKEDRRILTRNVIYFIGASHSKTFPCLLSYDC